MACALGRMDRLIDIQEKTTAQDGAGQPIEDWTDLSTNVWAEWIPVSGREFFAAQQTNATALAQFRIRYRSDITVGSHRIVYDGNTYDIAEAEEDKRFGYKEFLFIRAVARVS